MQIAKAISLKHRGEIMVNKIWRGLALALIGGLIIETFLFIYIIGDRNNTIGQHLSTIDEQRGAIVRRDDSLESAELANDRLRAELGRERDRTVELEQIINQQERIITDFSRQADDFINGTGERVERLQDIFRELARRSTAEDTE